MDRSTSKGEANNWRIDWATSKGESSVTKEDNNKKI